MKALRISIIILVLLSLIAGCAGMSPREQRVISSGVIGAGAGAALGAVTGHSVAGGEMEYYCKVLLFTGSADRDEDFEKVRVEFDRIMKSLQIL